MSISTLDNPKAATPDVAGQLLPATDWQPDAGSGAESSFMPSGSSTAKAGRSGAINKLEVAEVTAQLAIMTRSGVDLASAVSSLADQCQRPALAAVLVEVRSRIGPFGKFVF